MEPQLATGSVEFLVRLSNPTGARFDFVNGQCPDYSELLLDFEMRLPLRSPATGDFTLSWGLETDPPALPPWAEVPIHLG